MANEKRKAMLLQLANAFRQFGFKVEKNNKVFYIEYPSVCVKIYVENYSGVSKLAYNFRFKGIHSDDDFINDVVYDTIHTFTLNAHYGAVDDFHFYLEDININEITYWVEKMVLKYIEPFKIDPIKAITKGREEYDEYGKIYIHHYHLFKDVALALNLPELSALYTRSSFGGENCIGYEDLEGAFIDPKYIANKRGRQIVEERLKKNQK